MATMDDKILFENNTLASVENRICATLNISPQQLKTCAKTDDLPKKYMKDENDANKTLHCGTYSARANYSIGFAKDKDV
eukprot:10269968-Ditylum_brightwellii.AAC.1